jgi:hypothetical protein
MKLTDRWALGGWATLGGVGRPHLAVTWLPLRCGVFPILLESSGVVFVVDKYDFN